MTRRIAMRLMAVSTATAAITATCGVGLASAGGAPPPNIVAAPTLVAATPDGDVGYREVGTGSPLLLIMGFSGSMDAWSPQFVDSLAVHHRVIVFDNAGIGETSALPAPVGISAMAQQVSALISTLRLRRTAVLGWSMGGMIGQALAVLHPRQVSRLVLAATQAGTGRSLPIPPAAAAKLNSPDPAVVLSVLFPADQTAAAEAYAEGILEYPGYYTASPAVRDEQNLAVQQWMAGSDPAGLGRVHVPTLVADGTMDELDPAANDVLLTRGIHGAHLVLFPDAGHAFWAQDTAEFVPMIDWLLR